MAVYYHDQEETSESPSSSKMYSMTYTLEWEANAWWWHEKQGHELGQRRWLVSEAFDLGRAARMHMRSLATLCRQGLGRKPRRVGVVSWQQCV